jgi:hypothetical protein
MDDDTIMNITFIFSFVLFLLILPILFAVMFYISRDAVRELITQQKNNKENK